MVDYSSLASTAERLIESNGQAVTLRTESSTSADANKPWRAATGAATDISAYAVLLDYTEKDFDGGLIRRGDKRALISPVASASMSPQDLDALIDSSSKIWKVQTAAELNPGGTRVLLEAQVRA